ncbi:acyltransferase family protein [Bombiscardovia coagulans]|uniref:Acyltransferase 3 domain-containing protein n=1 Tax=Bombiscardovia coagulans TaxID=686666 RepID=A0A261EUW3_9BIFI|nr:acyltransferase family protein [Bombiscardovia coagulans]OZG50654.1 hypothetical protein BOCO_0254 [Bombiscardovia coagulans]
MSQATTQAEQQQQASIPRHRNIRVEALRLTAIAGISIFHVFTPWFWGMTHMGVTPGPEHVVVSSALANSSLPIPWLLLWGMGVIALLGSWGNHVFYMISGFYMLPNMVRQVGSRGYWLDQFKAGLRRCLLVVSTVAVYAILMLLVDHFVLRIPAAGTIFWIGPGLEFVWLYLIFVILAPIWAVAVRHFGDNKWAQVLFLLLVLGIYIVNVYIAFMEQGDPVQRGLFNWRKQMSAVTYMVSYAVAGVLGVYVHKKHSTVQSSKWVTSGFWRNILFCLMVVVIGITGVWAGLGRTDLLYSLSFKSTSILAFLLALAALLTCALKQNLGFAHLKLSKVIQSLASGILGFYIVQSLSNSLWDPYCARILGGMVQQGLYGRFLLVGIVFALFFALLVSLIDRLVRQPLFRSIGLSK